MWNGHRLSPGWEKTEQPYADLCCDAAAALKKKKKKTENVKSSKSNEVWIPQVMTSYGTVIHRSECCSVDM